MYRSNIGIFFINVPFWGWWEDEKWLHNGEFILKNQRYFFESISVFFFDVHGIKKFNLPV